MAKSINKKNPTKKEEVKQEDNKDLSAFYALINDNILHVETLLFTSKMLTPGNSINIYKVKEYLTKHNSTLCVDCNKNADVVTSLLNSMAYKLVNPTLQIPFPQYNSAFLQQSNGKHTYLPLHEIQNMLEGVIFSEAQKEKLYNPDCCDLQNDYNNLLEYLKNRRTYSQFLTDKLNSFTINTSKDKEVYDEIERFINKFR